MLKYCPDYVNQANACLILWTGCTFLDFTLTKLSVSNQLYQNISIINSNKQKLYHKKKIFYYNLCGTVSTHIEKYVKDFIAFARNNPNLTFLVTEIGCGLAGFKPEDIAPLFKDAVNVENIHLPERFWIVLV